ncbi:hypothetical protein F5890DRAFT_1515881 [Lentinula detonsa]|uniref:Uncharacterized protein n=1 Tax=Lentinula detonsa TaxID=2804962 RepID=A0AA38PZM9_9AGAR|nr:hypothetical protein F5890DRAFT_1515881 [Lentinula detonsa]
MTPEETVLLQEGGELFVRDFAYTVPLTLLYGTYALLAFQALYTMMKRRKTIFSWVLIALLIITFLVITTYLCLYEASVFVLMQTALVKNTDLSSLEERFTIASDSIVGLDIGLMWLGGVNGLLYMSGDGIVVWRSWAVWNGKRIVVILPIFFLFATFAIFLTSSTMRTIAFVNPSIIEPDSLFGSLVIAGYTASIATNFTSTVLIGIQAYQHRKFMKKVGIGSSVAVKVLLLLTESGVLYIIFQIINLCLAFLDDGYNSSSPFNVASHIWGLLMNLVAATYPTLIILIVHDNRSISHLTDSSGSGSTLFGQTHISFAQSPAVNSTMAGQESGFGSSNERAPSGLVESKSSE